MKKTVALLLFAALILCLTACSHNDAPAPTPSPTDEAQPAVASDTDTQHVPPASPTDLDVDEEGYAKALDCVGLTIQQLYDTIGQPVETPVYSALEEPEGAQEGRLTYKGYCVVTLRTATEETVQSIEVIE